MNTNNFNDIREKFLNYLTSRNHFLLPNFSLIPMDDDSLLWINAGVTTIKHYFLKKAIPPSKLLCQCQKVLRTNDLENIGVTNRHLTFFEMLGYFSISGYQDQHYDPIKLAFDFLTNPKSGIGLSSTNFVVTYFKDDLETKKAWQKFLNNDQIIPMGRKTNFWDLGVGPCGPNTEIFYDRGDGYDANKDGLNLIINDIDNSRYLEIWNIVFSKFHHTKDNQYELLLTKNVDTGVGFERLIMLLEKKNSVLDTSLFLPIIHEISSYFKVKFIPSPKIMPISSPSVIDKNRKAIHIICDHLRAIAFIINEGIRPGVKKKEYILRRLIRRAWVQGYILNSQQKTPFLYKLIDIFYQNYCTYYHDLNKEIIKNVIKNEETFFLKTFSTGIRHLKNAFSVALSENNKVFSGVTAFYLVQTYGIPFEIISDFASHYGVTINQSEYTASQNIHKQISYSSSAFAQAFSSEITTLKTDQVPATKFLGYTHLETTATLLLKWPLSKPHHFFCIFNKTPFYPEGGGQDGDNGMIVDCQSKKIICKVLTTKKITDDIIYHLVYELKNNSLIVNESYDLHVNQEFRKLSSINHTTTHLLYALFLKNIDCKAKQSGSMLNDHQLRFDLSSNVKLTVNHLKQITNEFINIIHKRLPLSVKIAPVQDVLAKKVPVIDFQKVKILVKKQNIKEVRIVSINHLSVELCGGTHLNSTQEIPAILILKPQKISANIYRFEAYTNEALIRTFLLEKIDDLQVTLALKLKKTQFNDIVNNKQILSQRCLQHLEVCQSQIITVNTLIKTWKTNIKNFPWEKLPIIYFQVIESHQFPKQFANISNVCKAAQSQFWSHFVSLANQKTFKFLNFFSQILYISKSDMPIDFIKFGILFANKYHKNLMIVNCFNPISILFFGNNFLENKLVIIDYFKNYGGVDQYAAKAFFKITIPEKKLKILFKL